MVTWDTLSLVQRYTSMSVDYYQSEANTYLAVCYYGLACLAIYAAVLLVHIKLLKGYVYLGPANYKWSLTV